MKEKINAWLDKPWTNRTYIKMCIWASLIALPCYAIGICCVMIPEKIIAFNEKVNKIFKQNKEVETETEPE